MSFGDTQFYVLIVTLGNKIVFVISPLHVAFVSMVRALAQAPHDRVVPDLFACNGIGVCVFRIAKMTTRASSLWWW